MQSSKQGMRKGCHLSIEGIPKGYLFGEKLYIKGYEVEPRGGASPFMYKQLLSKPFPPPPRGVRYPKHGDTQVTVTSQLFKQALRNHDSGGAKTSLYLDLLHTNYYYSIYPVSSSNWNLARGVTKNRCLKYTSSLRVWKVHAMVVLWRQRNPLEKVWCMSRVLVLNEVTTA